MLFFHEVDPFLSLFYHFKRSHFSIKNVLQIPSFYRPGTHHNYVYRVNPILDYILAVFVTFFKFFENKMLHDGMLLNNKCMSKRIFFLNEKFREK